MWKQGRPRGSATTRCAGVRASHPSVQLLAYLTVSDKGGQHPSDLRNVGAEPPMYHRGEKFQIARQKEIRLEFVTGTDRMPQEASKVGI
jgi:hypothetical protein